MGDSRRIDAMKKLTVTAMAAVLSLAACAAKVCEWPQLPEGTLPDAEVATNIPLRVNAERLDVFSLRLQVSDETASEVLVAVGHDADENGDLSEDETAFVFGDDCGERYLVDCQEGIVADVTVDMVSIGHRHFNPVWDLAKVVKRGPGSVGETVSEIIENKTFSIRLR